MRGMYTKRKSLFSIIGSFGIFAIILQFAFYGGLIYFTFWCLKHFGIL